MPPSPTRPVAARAGWGRRPVACASAHERSRSASHGLRGSKRAVEIRADRAPDAAALETGLAVVAEARDDSPERLRAGIETRTACMVLETRDRPRLTRHELAGEQHIADHPPLAGLGLVGKEAGSGQGRAVSPPIAAAEQLVAAADCEQRRTAVDGSNGWRLRVRRDQGRSAPARGPGRRRCRGDRERRVRARRRRSPARRSAP